MVALAFCGGAMAQEAPRLVEVKGMRDPQMQAYRGVWAGLDAFDQYRRLAPTATPLQFRVRPHRDNKGASIAGMSLDIVGKGEAIPVAIGADGLFRIERNQAAYDDKADLVFNHKRHLFTAFAEVRTPGLPAGVRRLGDVRLECQVNVAMLKTEIPLYIRMLVTGLFKTSDWCARIDIYRSIPLEGLGKATLVHGERRQIVTLRELRDGIKIPVADWPDESLLELDYAAPDAS